MSEFRAFEPEIGPLSVAFRRLGGEFARAGVGVRRFGMATMRPVVEAFGKAIVEKLIESGALSRDVESGLRLAGDSISVDRLGIGEWSVRVGDLSVAVVRTGLERSEITFDVSLSLPTDSVDLTVEIDSVLP